MSSTVLRTRAASISGGPVSVDVTAWPATAREAACAVLDEHRAALLAWLRPPIAIGDVEAVHEMRTALRRLDSTLRLFRRLLPESMVQLRTELRAELKALGAVRNLDELIRLLRAEAGHRRRGDTAVACASLVGRLAQQRKSLAAPLARRLVRLSRAELSTEFVRTLGCVWPNAAAESPAQPLVAALICERRRKLLQATDRLRCHARAKLFHRARKRAKRLGDAIEGFERQLGATSADFQADLQRFRSRVGELQDAVVARRAFSAMRRQLDLSDSELRILRRIVREQKARALNARNRSLRAAHQLRGKPWKRLARALGPAAALP